MRFLENASRIAHGVFDRYLIAHKGHINHDHRIFDATNHSRSVSDHVLDSHCKRIRIAQHDVSEAIAHENRVH